MSTYGGKYAKEINAAASKNGISPWLIEAVIFYESSFNPKAGSGAGAKGLMQLMDGTFKSYGSGDIYNPADNINAGSKYLATQIKSFGTVKLGLAAYNAGPGNVKKYNGVPPFSETQNYVKNVYARYQKNESGLLDTVQTAAGKIDTGVPMLDGMVKSPILWVTLLVVFLFK